MPTNGVCNSVHYSQKCCARVLHSAGLPNKAGGRGITMRRQCVRSPRLGEETHCSQREETVNTLRNVRRLSTLCATMLDVQHSAQRCWMYTTLRNDAGCTPLCATMLDVHHCAQRGRTCTNLRNVREHAPLLASLGGISRSLVSLGGISRSLASQVGNSTPS